MVSSQQLSPLPVRAGDHTVPAVTRDVGFETGWTAWVERGRLHEQRTRRTLVVWASALSVGVALVAIVYALLRP
jgi:NADPH:quinone reductase-like Zn-dependent oxidoreductase